MTGAGPDPDNPGRMRFAALISFLVSACAAGAALDPWEREVRISRRPAAPPPRTAATAPATPTPAPEAAAPRIEALPARLGGELEIARATVRAALAAGPQRFMSGILLDPFFVDRKFVGFKLARFYDGDPRFAPVDLKRGDVVLRVNGLPIERPDQFMRAWEELRTADEISIEYLRGAEKRLLRLRIRD